MIDNKYSGPILKKGHKNFHYDRKFQQLQAILADTNYWPKGEASTMRTSKNISYTNSYQKFVGDMMVAIKKGRNITPKMHNAIYGIVKRYMNSTDPVKVQERDKRIETINDKLDMVKNKLILARYAKSTEYGGISFLDSIAQQVGRTGRLSIKQKEALNKMHNKALKRIATKSNEK
jgi:hypothetical protein